MPLKMSKIANPDAQTATVTLHPTDHFDFAYALEFVNNSGAHNHLDQIDDDHTCLERPLRMGDSVVWVELTRAKPTDDKDQSVLLTVRTADDTPAPDEATVKAVADWANQRFFMDVDMKAVEKALAVDDYGEEVLTRFYPARPSNYPSAWEALVKSIINMQIFDGFARKLTDYLCRNYGTEVTFKGETYHMIPTPEELLAANPEDLQAAKFSRQKADFLTTIPRQILDAPDTYDFVAMRERDGAEIVAALKELHGVGDWVSQNVAMRGLPHPDVFIDEKATRKTLTPYYGKADKLGKKAMRDAVERFAPYRTFACYYTYMKHFNME